MKKKNFENQKRERNTKRKPEENGVKKNSRAKKAAFIAAGVLVAAAAAFSVYRAVPKGPSTVVLYDLNEREEAAISDSIRKVADEKSVSIVSLKSDAKTEEKTADREFERALKKSGASLVFVKSGLKAEKAVSMAKDGSELDDAKLNIGEMTTSMKGAVKAGKEGVKSVPVIFDNMEIDIEITALKNSGMAGIAGWDDIEKLAVFQKRYVENPIVFAGKDSELALDIFGALTEAMSGADEYRNAVEIINSHSGADFNAARVARLLTEKSDNPLYKAVLYLSRLYKQGLLHPNTFNLEKNDVKAFAKARIASIIFMSLNDHRTFEPKVISRFTSIYFPSEFSGDRRKFTAPVTCAVPLKKDKAAKSIVESIVTAEEQERISFATGLAPVLARCRTPDLQSSDARHWVASTDTPLSGLSADTNLTKAQRAQLVNELAAIVTR
ncbi:MAG: hypothetical protein IJ717_12270 [Treponema sp.]|nr:hypothetical protein [Treponema sp.]